MKTQGPIREGELPSREQADDELVPPGARRVLDVGCSSGQGVFSLAERLGPGTLVVGLDPCLERIDEAQRAARNVALNVRFAVGDARSLPFSDSTFDVVRAPGRLVTAHEPARVMRELVRVAAPGGRVLVHEAPPIASSPTEAEGAEDELPTLMRRAGLTRLEQRALRVGAHLDQGSSVTVIGVKPSDPEEGPTSER